MRLATIYFTSNLIAIFGGLPQTHWSLIRLLTQLIYINCVSHNFYDTNQLTSEATSVIQKTPKLQICDLPLSVTYFSVHELLDKSNVELTSKNMNEKIRHPKTNRMKCILNGTNIMYIDPLLDGTINIESTTVVFFDINLFTLVNQKTGDNLE